ncbi:inner membrane protein YpjD [Sulfurivirga sp.]|uniref:cytochrome C assembly family protein n=1 Tax=Sulfurivirga sp. TaxID=2614236 RepID=UPI0025D4EB52|nr:cytochrome c biogenesis protein CcsA [Sulfurivirga sp.]
MISSGFLGALAAPFYLYAFFVIFMRLRFDLPADFKRVQVCWSSGVATLLHGASLWLGIHHDGAAWFSLGIGLSLIGWAASAALLLIAIARPVEALGLFVWPFALLGLVAQNSMGLPHALPPQYGVHVLLAVMAYSLLGLAAAQAVLYSVQERNFKRQRLTRLFRTLPPLAMMENTLYGLLVIGFVVLTLALITGALFVDDLFGQHLVHKTFFSMLAWLVYAGLLWGHWRRGWRGQKAVRATLIAFGLLVLGYVGSQFVLEILLNRP